MKAALLGATRGMGRALARRLAERGDALRPHLIRLQALLDDYGPQELATAVEIALARDALGAGSIAHLLEARRRQRGHIPPVPMILPDRPGVRDLTITPHRLESYDNLSRPDANDARGPSSRTRRAQSP